MVPSDPVPVPPTPTTPPQESPPQVPASTLSSSEQSINPGENTSGMGSGSEVPPGVDGWGWGPFFFTGIWGIFNNVWISLIAWIPIFPVGLIMVIVLGINGRKWAWQKKKWDSVEQFNKTQRKWSIAGIWVFGISLILIPIFVWTSIVAINPAGRISQAENNDKVNTDVRTVGISVYDCIVDQISKETPTNTIYSDIELDIETGKGGCASSTNLIQGGYLSTIPSEVSIISAVDKVCVYKATSGSPSGYASYDSSEGVVVTVPNGTSNCN